jgi:hypothetical protein
MRGDALYPDGREVGAPLYIQLLQQRAMYCQTGRINVVYVATQQV